MARTKGVQELAGGLTFDVRRDGDTRVLLKRFREELDPEIVKFLDQGQRTQWGVGLLFCNDSTIPEPRYYERRLLCACFPVRPGFDGLVARAVEQAKVTTKKYNLACHEPYFDKTRNTVSFIIEGAPQKVAEQLWDFAGIVNEAYRAFAEACAWKPTQQSGPAYDDLVNAAAEGKSPQDIVSDGNAWLNAQRNERASGREGAARVERWAAENVSPEFRARSSRGEDLIDRTPKRSWSTERTSQPRSERPSIHRLFEVFHRSFEVFAELLRRAGRRGEGEG